MWSEYLQFIQPLTSAFDLEEVTTSVTSFLGSGYIGVILVALLALSAVKKVAKLIGVTATIGIIWLVCTTGLADQLIAQVQGLLS